MASASLVINGYKIPSGRSGNAVRYGAHLLSENPGMKMSEFLPAVAKFSNLNESHAGWLTSAKIGSPATTLWRRQHEGQYRLYLQPGAEVLVGTHISIDQCYIDLCHKRMKALKINFGDLVEINVWDQRTLTETKKNGVLIDYRSNGLVNVLYDDKIKVVSLRTLSRIKG